MVKGSQHTILFNVDDLKCSHKKKTVNDDFAQWLEKTYGQHGKVKVHSGKVHEYLGMKLDYSEKKKLKIDMRDYVKGMLDIFPIPLLTPLIDPNWINSKLVIALVKFF